MGEAPRDKARIEYDPDTRMLAFLGTLTLLVGSLFWVLLGVRLLLDSDAQAAWAPAAGLTALAMGPLGALCALTAWGLRMKLQTGEPITAWEVRRLLAAGLVVGVVVGFVVYVAMAYKLKDPGFMHVAGEPGAEHAGTR